MLSIGRNIGQTISIGKAGDVLTGPIIVPLPNGRVRYSKSAIKKWMTERTVSY